MSAMDRAVQDGMDILSISIDSLGWAESASAELASRIAAKIPVIVSIGNDGTQGIWTSGKLNGHLPPKSYSCKVLRSSYFGPKLL